MRLIDADAMKDTNDNVIAVIDPETKSKYWISLNDYINAQPTVDTIKHAHWVRVARSENEYWQCSNCHGYFTLPMPKYRGFHMRYCGCCGAEMDIQTPRVLNEEQENKVKLRKRNSKHGETYLDEGYK